MEQQTVILRQVEGAEPVEEPVLLPDSAPNANEGKTLAGWTLMYVVGLGAALVALGMVLSTMPLLWAGVAVIVVGFVASAILRALGHGQPRVSKDGDVVA